MTVAKRELGDFLRRARSRVDPSRAGLPADGRVRRVPGLRREEVALLAGVSTDYYTRLEQGRPITPSPGVVEAIARALALDAASRAHLEHLLGAPPPAAKRRAPTVARVRPGLHEFLDTLDAHPAFILGRRTEILASNHLARALLADFERLPVGERNYARWVLLSDEARNLFVEWGIQARAAVESLRLAFGKDPEDPATLALVAELMARSPEFRPWWDAHGVYQRTFGTKKLRHPIVGELTVNYETLTLPGDAEQTMFIYTTEAGTASRQAMGLLASWAQPVNRHQRQSHGATDKR